MIDWGFTPLSAKASFAATSGFYIDAANGDRDAFYGNISYDAQGYPSGGVITHIQENLAGFIHFDISGFSVSATGLIGALSGSGSFSDMFAGILSGPDQITGSSFDDILLGHDGNDTIAGHGGFDQIYGGAGDDVITTEVNIGSAQSFVRGEEGNDLILGGINFDDLNGNQGADTIHGAGGADWVVGGQGNDLLFGDDGADIVYGNMGADTLDGGAGADLVRGGQDADSLSGGAGNDWLSGDMGDDTIAGGSGADTFHISVRAGLDRVIDFSAAEGDRVQLDSGAVYSVAQVGSDVVITLDQAQMVLVGVNLATLPNGWLFTL